MCSRKNESMERGESERIGGKNSLFRSYPVYRRLVQQKEAQVVEVLLGKDVIVRLKKLRFNCLNFLFRIVCICVWNNFVIVLITHFFVIMVEE